jgi:hypothetical protein
LAGILAGCESIYFPISLEYSPEEELTLEVLRPADTAISQSIKTLLVFSKPGLIPRIIVKAEKLYLYDNIKFLKLPDIELHSMADQLSESPRFSIFEPASPVNPAAGDEYSLNEMDTLCAKAGTDGCLILSQQDVYIGIYSVADKIHYSFFTLVSSYRLYDRAERKLLSKYVKTKIDDINDIDDEIDGHGLDSMVLDFARENGGKLVYWIAPIWQQDTRNYYLTGNKEMESVKDLIKNEKWATVSAIWRKYCNSENPIVAEHAAYNTILSYEMEGNLDSALILARSAYKRFRSEEIVDYGLILEERIRENERVKIQMGIK